MSESALPFELRPENVVVETFVAPEEWQAAVTEWGTAQGLDVLRLRALGLYPYSRPVSAETVRRTGLRLAQYAGPGVAVDHHRPL